MLYSLSKMAIVFVIARDWTLRAAVRAELRELGIEALGLESAEDVERALAAGQMPASAVLEATADLAADPAVQSLVGRVPTIVIASRTESVPLPSVAAVLYRPVRVADIVSRVGDILIRGTTA
ncbi:MAG: hypothetical protein ACRD5M_11775 [Candidatus Acidiferrales bacterium]